MIDILKTELAYGKFDFDFNSDAFSAVEVDLLQYFRWEPKTQKNFIQLLSKKSLKTIPRFSVRPKREQSEYEDLLQIWNEIFSKETLYYSVYSGRKKWDEDLSLHELEKLPKKQNYFFEWGQDDRISNTNFLKDLSCFNGFVIDPDWHAKYARKMKYTMLRFKLHGWNDQRWVRRYGAANSARISKFVSSYLDSSLVLSYSGKVEEAKLFQNS